MKIFDNGTLRNATAEEEERIKTERALEPSIEEKKLARIKNIRLEKLQATDWWVLRGDITDEQKLFRKNLRDIPTNYNSSKYDELLARDSDGKLTHTVWEKP